jgi:bifunctional non-homologous end joining protein LigD
MKINPLPAGFVVPARPFLAEKPPSGADWVHEIKHDGYRMIVRRDGPTVRLYSRNAYDWTVRLAAIAAAAELIKAKSFTIDGEAVVLGPDGLSRFEELSGRAAARTAILYAFDLMEHDGEDLRNLPVLDRKAALGRLLRRTKAGILLNEHIAEDGATVFAHACRLGAEGIVSKRIDSPYRSGPCRVCGIAFAHGSKICPSCNADFGIIHSNGVEYLTQQHRGNVFIAEPLGKNVAERILETGLIKHACMSEAAEDGLLVSQGGGGAADGIPNRIVTSDLPNVFHKNLQASVAEGHHA